MPAAGGLHCSGSSASVKGCWRSEQGLGDQALPGEADGTWTALSWSLSRGSSGNTPHPTRVPEEPPRPAAATVRSKPAGDARLAALSWVLGLGLGARSCRHWGSDSQQQWRKEGEVTCGVLTWSPLGPAAPPGPCVERRLSIGVRTPAVCSPGPGARRVPHGAPPPRTAGPRVGAPTFGRVSSTGNWVGPFARAPQDPVTERLLVSLGAVCWAGLAPTCGSADGREPFRRHRARGRPRRPQP